jgi:uncharacterized membrane protein
MGGCAAGMTLGGLVILLLLVGVAYIVYRLVQSGGQGLGSPSTRSGDALELARRRYAQGEVKEPPPEAVA